MNVTNISGNTTNRYRTYIPWTTAVCCLVSIVLFIGINFESSFDTWAPYKKWGAPYCDDVWNGAYWGLITTNFLHTSILHISFNLCWVWIFGKKIEFLSSRIFFAAFIMSTAFVSSVTQLFFGETTGIGLSGVVFAFFGYLLVRQKTDKRYAKSINKVTICVFIIWQLLCFELDYARVYQVGNAAHVAGFLWGILVARISRYKKPVQFALATIIVGLLSITVFWNPWSITWLINKAYNLHTEGKLKEAKVLYLRILRMDTKNEFARDNLKKIRVDSLSDAAYDADSIENYSEALRLYKQILEIDPGNKSAKENMDSLPTK